MLLDKTDKGRDEIATRQYHLAPRLRTLLLLIDGKHPIEELLEKLASVGFTEQHLTELIDGGFVYDIAPPPPPPKATELLESKLQQLDALYAFYTENIRSAIGLRGYALQAKVNHASSLKDFQNLRIPFLEAVLAAQGDHEARRLRDQLDPLLFGGPPASAKAA